MMASAVLCGVALAFTPPLLPLARTVRLPPRGAAEMMVAFPPVRRAPPPAVEPIAPPELRALAAGAGIVDVRFHAMRHQGARLVQRYVKLQPTIGQAVEREWRALFGGHTGGVLGLHIRGTDVMETDAIFSARRRLVTDTQLVLE